MKQKILFVKSGSFSHISQSLISALQAEFPQHPIEVFDVNDDFFMKSKFLRRINWLFFLLEYGFRFLFNRKLRVYACYHHTSFKFRQIKKHIGRRFNKLDYLFSFQSQSLFDASIPELPHFLYTDSTVLANNYIKGIDKDEIFYQSQSWMKLERTVYHNTACNFVPVQEQVTSLIEHYGCPPERAACVYFGSNVVPVNFDFDESRYSKKNILFNGVEWERKGGPLTVEVFKEVLKQVPDAHLTIIGCKPEIAVPNCTVLGRVSKEEVDRQLRTASVFCLPTKLDYICLALLEAMYFKLPVITSDLFPMKTFIEHGVTGYLFPPLDKDRYVKALVELLQNPMRCKEFGEKGFQIASEKFTWENTGKLMKQHILPHLSPQ